MTKTAAQKLRKKAAGAALMAAAASAARASSKKKSSTKKAVKIVEAAEKKGGWLVPSSSLQVKIGDVPAGRAVGSAVGSLFGEGGSAVGGWFGDLLHRGFRSLSGMGDYKGSIRMLKDHLGPHANGSIMLSQKMPLFSSSREDPPNTIIYEERIATIYSTINYTTASYRLNPGLPTTFPWLSSIASSYENYRCLGMVVQSRSLLSEAAQSANGVVGEWGLCSEVNPTAAAPATYNAFTTHSFSDTQRGTEPCITGVECDSRKNPNTPWKQVSFPGDTTDKHFTDQGVVHVATQGYPANGIAVGSLWVTYKIAFNNPVSNAISTGVSSQTWMVDMTATAGAICNVPAGANVLAGSKLGGSWPLANQFKMPNFAGNYQMIAIWSGVAGFSSGGGISASSSDVTLHSNTTGGTGYYSGGAWTSTTYLSIISGNTSILVANFNYTNASNPTSDFTFTAPVGTANMKWAFQMWLYPREYGLSVLPPNPIDAEEVQSMIRSSMLKLFGSDAEDEQDEVGDTQYFILGVTNTDNGPTYQQWPYDGPIPPPVASSAVRQPDIQSAVKSALSAHAAAAAPPKDWREIDESTRNFLNNRLMRMARGDSNFKQSKATIARRKQQAAMGIATFGVDTDSRRESFSEVTSEEVGQTSDYPVASAASAAVVPAGPDLKAYVEQMEPTQRTAFLEKIKTYLPL